MTQRFPFIQAPFRRSTLLRSIVLSWIAACLIVPAALAQVWNESPDAGELPGTAQITVGTGLLTEIDGGLLDATDVDMYCVRVTDPASFRARLQCVAINGPDIRMFRSSGVGASANFLCQAGDKFVSGNFATTIGTYYIAVSYRGREPFAVGLNSIWLATNLAEHAPDGPGAAGAVIAWGGNPIVQQINPYRILLTGATYCATATSVQSQSWGTLKLIYH